MKSTASFKREMSAIRRRVDGEDYAGALAKVDGLLDDWPGSSRLSVLRAELIQLQEQHGPPLEDARECLKRAIDLDDGAAEPYLELGHFQLAVEDDVKSASRSFAKALEIHRQGLLEALLGYAAALRELGRREEAFDCLAKAQWLQSSWSGKANRKSHAEPIFAQWEELSSDA